MTPINYTTNSAPSLPANPFAICNRDMSSKLAVKQLENESRSSERVPKNQVEAHSHSIHIVFIKRQAILHNLRSAIVVVVVGLMLFSSNLLSFWHFYFLQHQHHTPHSLPRPCACPYISCTLYSFYSYYSFHRTLRFVSYSFAVAFIGPMPGNLLLLCHIYCPYRIHTRTATDAPPVPTHTLYMFIHTAADDSNQDNKNKYYTIFDCVRPLAKLRNSFSYLTAHNSHFISISQTSTYICIHIFIYKHVCICSRIVFLLNFV